ncbi:efflux RND transporter periplasmic adaptor subunit [uncultured Alistipes sp.]|jgi:membrane fusion protein (multidrug efflux system)|uniref:efflux RND transporter periplasmic adaptor subunit n=1 Tax=uncultured Alistipes sp. TaxID=538949 RepID=UPI001F85B82F|nr:efflux RND transporter periplasmic adaptor subunit [uncultured Alistipes sp.]HIV32366.1 efflux RND transporter periplasmic adaptor subunit [Candidatus Alistipes excrementigallinarum]
MKQTFVQAALVACCMAVVSCGQAPTQQRAAEYSVQTITTTDRTIPTNYSATIRGRQDIAIYPQVSGTISQVCITEGQRVTKGQTLFIIDQVPYKAALRTAEANVEAAKAAVATAQLTYDSKKELFSRNVVSQYDLSTAENSLLTAKAQLAQADAALVNAANNLSYTVVKAPSNGVVGTLPYRVGALVSASIPQPLTTVSDNSTMYVYFSMTAKQQLNLTRRYGSIAETLKNMPDVQLQLNDGTVYDQTGRVESISGVVDTSTGSVQLRAVFPNENGLLLSGSTGNIIMPNLYKDCIVVPQTATFEIQDKVYVYKLVDGKATSSMIEVEKISNGREYIVTAGLTPGEVIITEGVGLMREGTPVVPKGQAAAAAAQTTENGQAAEMNQTAAQSEEAAAQTQNAKEE